MRSARGSCRSGGDQRRAPRNCPVAIDAIELNGSTRLAVKFPAAMAVLLEVTIDALHPFLQVNILEMHGFIEFLRIIGRNRASLLVEQMSLAISREHGAKQPAMTVKISKLRRLQFLIELRAAGLCKELQIRPESARGRAFRIALRDLEFFFLGEVPLLFRVHCFAVGFVVPPRVAKIRGHHIRARMDVAHHALARRNRARKLVADRMAWLAMRNRRVFRSAEAAVAERRVLRGMLN